MKTILETDQDFICEIQAPCFQLLNEEEIELIRASKTQILFRKGDNLTKQGAFSSYILFIIKGLAKQYIEGDDNKSFNQRIIQPGEFVGLSAVFAKNTYNYSSQALTDCQVFIVDKEAITKVIATNGTFGLNIIRRYCEQNVNLFGSLRNQLFKQMNGRMAETLLYLDGLKVINPEIFQLLSRKDIADFANVSVESAVKLLKAFEKDTILTLKDKDIIINDRSRLDIIYKNG